MIMVNLGEATVGNNQSVSFSPRDGMEFQITSAEGTKTSGTLGASDYTEVIAKGSAPWKVEMGTDDFSRSATVEGIDSQERILSCIQVNPRSSNEDHIFVNK